MLFELTVITGQILGIALGGLLVAQGAWALFRWWFLPPITGETVSLVARSLGQAIRHGRSLDLALLGLQARLRWPLPRRIRRAARSLNGPDPESLIPTLVAAGVLPRDLAPTGRAAEALGPAALVRWLDGLAGERTGAIAWWTPLLPPLLSVVGGTILFFSAIVLYVPRFGAIIRELGLQMPSELAVLIEASKWKVPLICAALGLLIMCIWLFNTWRWRREAWYARGLLLTTGTAHGISEARLAELVTHVGADPALRHAAAAGDFAGVARAAGWPCRDPLDLQRRYALALDRRLRHRRVLVISAQLLAPLILAVPVWIIVKAIMGTLILVMNAQEVY